MAPIGDKTVQDLQNLVDKLESRVKQLEDKLQHAAGGPAPSTSSSVRMILIGPPGAGMFSKFLLFLLPFCPPLSSTCQICSAAPANYSSVGKGTQAPMIKEKFSCCHLVSWIFDPAG